MIKISIYFESYISKYIHKITQIKKYDWICEEVLKKSNERFKSVIKEPVDVLFIDTSHLYEHTVRELAAWFPLLANKALVIFHDTNLDGKGYYRKDGKMEMNWDNKRGVTQAIEEYLNISIDETTNFDSVIQRGDIKWILKHYSNSNGLLLLWKN